jgi:N-acetylneuraminic acid mutarotase
MKRIAFVISFLICSIAPSQSHAFINNKTYTTDTLTNDPCTVIWSYKAPLPAPRSGHASAVVNGILYVMGGGYLNTMVAYNPATNTWMTKASMPSTRWNRACGVINGQIYLAGGWGADHVVPIITYGYMTHQLIPGVVGHLCQSLVLVVLPV